MNILLHSGGLEVVHVNDFEAGTKFMIGIADELAENPYLYRSLGKADVTPEQIQLAERIKVLYVGFKKQGLFRMYDSGED